jgi:CheY-like chemotaxis protein
MDGECKGRPSSVNAASPIELRRPVEAMALLIEDNLLVAKIQARMLEKAGFMVRSAADGARGMLLFERFADQLSIVITDLIMPQLSGDQVCRQIHARRPEVPVILVSGSEESDCLRQPERYGFAAALRKPVVRAEFVETALFFARGAAPGRQRGLVTG